jgi:hypothetical protein
MANFFDPREEHPSLPQGRLLAITQSGKDMDFMNQFEHFRDRLHAIGALGSPLTQLNASLKMAGDGRFEVFYAPFDYVNPVARIVVVGITPGLSQALTAINTAARLLHAGRKSPDVIREAKMDASFAGPIRSKLVSLLDHVGLSSKLGICSTSELWGPRSDLVHFTSVLRYPVFEKGRNYTGAGIIRHPLLVQQIDTWFASECKGLRNALFVPLGTAAEAACYRMVEHGLLQRDRVLAGLPHPSPANSERITYFLGRKSASLLSSKTNGAQLDLRRERLIAQVSNASFVGF